MNYTETQIEAITRRVLRELSSRGVGIASARPETSPAPSQSSEHVAVAGIDAKVITEDTLAAANAAGQTILVVAGAVITPSGHDYIRRNSVTISNHAPAAANQVSSGVLVVSGNNTAATSAANTAKWNIISAGCDFDAAEKARGELSQPVVCSVAEPSLTACLLNRNAEIRAAVITQTTDIGLLGTIMNPQVICLDSAGWSFAALLKLFRRLVTGNTTAPDAWKELA